MDSNFFHFDFDDDNDDDNNKNDHTTTTTTTTTTTSMPDSRSHKKKLITRPNRNDVLCGRGGAVNSHPGNVAFRRLVHQHRTTYFAASTKKLDKARIAKEIIAQVHDLPGRFLKQDGKTGKWLEINEQKAKKKVGQAFRDITSHDERFRIGAGLVLGDGGADGTADAGRQSSDDDDGNDDDDRSSQDSEHEYSQTIEGRAEAAAVAAAAAGYYPQDDIATAPHMASASDSAVAYASMGGRKRQHSFDDDDLHSDGKESATSTADRPSTPPLPPLPAPLPPSSLRHAGTASSTTGNYHGEVQQAHVGLPPAAHAVGFRPIVQRTSTSSNAQEDNSMCRVDMSGVVATYNAHMQSLPNHYSRHTSHSSNTCTEPSTKFSHQDDNDDDMLKRRLSKRPRLPASEFALYPDAKNAVDNDGADAGVAAPAAAATGNANATAAHPTGFTDGQQSRRGSTESTELEKLTMELLVKRARTWEELYYSEREYSRSLEDRLVGLLGDRVARQQMPKRRRFADALAA